MDQVYVHGGVSGVPKEMPEITACAQRGVGQPTALDSVEFAVLALEEHPLLNAGYGSTLNRDGRLELDAAIADGPSGRHGGVVGVRVRNPISLARRVMVETPHVLMAGEGAMRIGHDMEILEGTTPEQEARYREARDSGRLGAEDYAAPEHVDTVGAVARDATSALAAASSTGGVFGKLPGRVGDSAVPGAGTFASESAAVVGTGVGEAFLESLACFRVALLIEEGLHPQEACERVIQLIGDFRHVSAGLLAIDSKGNVGAAYRGGAWVVAGPAGPIDAAQLD